MACNSCTPVNPCNIPSCGCCQPKCPPPACPEPEHPCYPKPCDPCGTPVATPMNICETPVPCTDGCEETLPCNCVIYKGPALPALNVLDGDTLCQVLVKLDTIVNNLVMGSGPTMANYNYTTRCAASGSVTLSLVTCIRNGSSQIMSSVQYPNAASLLAFLQSLDPAWTFTEPNVFSIHSADTWVLGISCPA